MDAAVGAMLEKENDASARDARHRDVDVDADAVGAWAPRKRREENFVDAAKTSSPPKASSEEAAPLRRRSRSRRSRRSALRVWENEPELRWPPSPVVVAIPLIVPIDCGGARFRARVSTAIP